MIHDYVRVINFLLLIIIIKTKKFAVSGPTLWNSLSPAALLTLTQFYAYVKTVLFCRAYETLAQRLREGCRDCRAILLRDTRDSSFAVNDNDRVAVISESVNDPFLAVPLR